jgi:hypothetical protein
MNSFSLDEATLPLESNPREQVTGYRVERFDRKRGCRVFL